MFGFSGFEECEEGSGGVFVVSFVVFCNLDGNSSWLIVVDCCVRKESRLDVLFNNGCVPFFWCSCIACWFEELFI